MTTHVLHYFIDQLIAAGDGLESFKPDLLTLLMPLLHKEHSQAARQLMIKDDIPRKLYIKYAGFAMGSRESLRNMFPVAPYLWLGPAVMADWRALLLKKPARFDISVEQHTDVYSLRLADVKFIIDRFRPVKGAIRNLVRNQNIYLNSYDRNLYQYDATERYLHMAEDFGDRLDSIAKKYQAAHVGIAPESLSRILRNLGRGGQSSLRHRLGMLLAL
ncbi:cyclic nucleotide-binding domain-containing protein [Parapedobacter koreensis]|uniref:cAMP-binding domain of CRP or a regulatory subunit of cAMP-dependent protein kinases n=1 Tax=Parapedobacter koreensis TaxID=332977 RepID=A0A1H7K2A5_9SPHI|nr:hypothetical protein [Parapedobacter koreensis]SEK80714.1 hypothetical protein SAMN05421740_102752 [Parapedobacter koreensis]